METHNRQQRDASGVPGGTQAGTRPNRDETDTRAAGRTQAHEPSGDRASGASEATTRETVNEVKQQAAEMADRAKEQGKTILARQKDAAAGQVDSVANAFRSTARQLEGEDNAEIGRYVGFAAERLESVGRRLREKDVDGLIDDAQDLARRSPAAFFGGSVVAGFLLARFLKSSAERSSTDRSRSEQRLGEHTSYSESHAGTAAAASETQAPASFTTTDATGGSDGTR